MGLTTTSIDVTNRHCLKVNGEVSHSTPGPEGTTLDEPFTMMVMSDKTTMSIHIEDCEAPTPEAAADKMVVWLRRLAEGIEKRGPSITLPGV